MASATIPVDLLNPGQVFGCIGILEATRLLTGKRVSGGFDWRTPGNATFTAECSGDASPVAAVLEFLAHADVSSVVRAGSSLSTDTPWDIPTHALAADDALVYREPSSPAALPARLSAGGRTLLVAHWGDTTKRDSVKFWAGAGGLPGAALLRGGLALARDQLERAFDDPFGISAPQSSSFRFDWRRDYVPIGVGFSLNNHSDLLPQGYPVTEILAAIGLSYARPLRPDPRNKLIYRYSVIGTRDGKPRQYPLPIIRAALGCAPLPFPARTFRIDMDWPGKENQARCITNVTEEN